LAEVLAPQDQIGAIILRMLANRLKRLATNWRCAYCKTEEAAAVCCRPWLIKRNGAVA
jgi:hypothetical protein